ncbi:hypothetical protein V8G54_020718, partial [Vigna mungo]
FTSRTTFPTLAFILWLPRTTLDSLRVPRPSLLFPLPPQALNVLPLPHVAILTHGPRVSKERRKKCEGRRREEMGKTLNLLRPTHAENPKPKTWIIFACNFYLSLKETSMVIG